MIVKEELQWWAGLVAAACFALIGVSVVPHPYDKALTGLCAVGGAIAAYQITPKKSQ